MCHNSRYEHKPNSAFSSINHSFFHTLQRFQIITDIKETAISLSTVYYHISRTNAQAARKNNTLALCINYKLQFITVTRANTECTIFVNEE